MDMNGVYKLLTYGTSFSETIQMTDVIPAGNLTILTNGVLTMRVQCKELLISSVSYNCNIFDTASINEVQGAGYIELQDGTSDANNVAWQVAVIAPPLGQVDRFHRISAMPGQSGYADWNYYINNFYANQSWAGTIQANASIFIASANPVNVEHRLILNGFYL